MSPAARAERGNLEEQIACLVLRTGPRERLGERALQRRRDIRLGGAPSRFEALACLGVHRAGARALAGALPPLGCLHAVAGGPVVRGDRRGGALSVV